MRQGLLQKAVLSSRHICCCAAQVHGLRADVSSSADMAALGAYAQRRLRAAGSTCDLWIYNAGEVTRKTLLADVDAEEVLRVVGAH